MGQSRTRFEERVDQVVELAEAVDGAQNNGARAIKAIGITADVINGNRRRYPRSIVERAVADLNESISQSPGSGRLIALGEAEHPSSKGGRSSLLETVVKWRAADLGADNRVILEGIILPTTKGNDVRTLVEHGVPIGVSMRGYGTSARVEEDGGQVEEVQSLTITGFDLVLEPSDPYAKLLESIQEMDDMDEVKQKPVAKPVEDVEERVNQHLAEAELKRQLAAKEEELVEGKKAQAKLAEMERQAAVAKAIEEATKDLPYGALNDAFLDAVMKAAPPDPKAVAALVEAKRQEYDAILAKAKLGAMGKVDVKGPVFEQETGQPEFTRASHQFTERLAERGLGTLRNFSEAKTKGELFARRYLTAFDDQYRRELLAESKMLEEAAAVSDLNLPYSVSRAIVAEAIPELVSASVFDFDLADTSPTRVYFEAYAAESGATADVADETYTADHDTWVALAYARVSPGTVVVELGGTATVKAEYTDYVVDYANGKIMVLSTGTISDSADLDVSYTYNAVRGGENAAIQRGKGTLSYQTIELAADRLAQQISDEAVTFARTQLGWDATTRTLSMLIREIREMIDQGVMRLAIAQAHIAANTGGTWTAASDSYQDLVAKIGVAKVAIQTDNYDPRFILMSLSNADKLSNWDGFTAAGMRADAMMTPGALGAGDTGLRIKGLPVFASKHMPDAKILVHHPELVQHRVLRTKPMTMKGPYASYDSGNLVAAEQYFVEEYNQTVSLIAAKGAYVTVA